MWETFASLLQKQGLNLVTMGNKINPTLGVILTFIVSSFLIFVGIKFKKNDSGTSIGSETGKDQNTADSVLNGTNDWLDGKK